MPPASSDAATPLERCTLDELRSTVSACTLCDLAETRTHAVPGTGNDDARVMIVLDAPGYFDDRSGSTLTGPGATSLERFLATAGLARDEVVITYCVKCRPPESRGPSRSEVNQCEGYLFRELALVAPDVVCTAGSLAARMLTSQGGSVANRRGQAAVATVQGNDVLVLPVYDPRVASHARQLDEQLTADGALVARALELVADGKPAAEIAADLHDTATDLAATSAGSNADIDDVEPDGDATGDSGGQLSMDLG